MYVVTDTHPWVWFLTANPRLSSKAKSTLMNSRNIIIIPSIVIMEIKYLYQRKRISLSFKEAIEKVETADNIILYPLDLSIASTAPTSLDIHDSIIVGTTLYLSEESGRRISLVTMDKTITNSKLVPMIW